MLKGLKSNFITILTISMIVFGGLVYTADNLNAEEGKKADNLYLLLCRRVSLCL